MVDWFLSWVPLIKKETKGEKILLSFWSSKEREKKSSERSVTWNRPIIFLPIPLFYSAKFSVEGTHPTSYFLSFGLWVDLQKNPTSLSLPVPGGSILLIWPTPLFCWQLKKANTTTKLHFYLCILKRKYFLGSPNSNPSRNKVGGVQLCVFIKHLLVVY